MKRIKVHLDYGQGHCDLDVQESKLIVGRTADRHAVGLGTAAEPIRDLADAVRSALTNPIGFPPLYQALTPDDHITVAVYEELTGLPQLVGPILETITQAGVSLDHITLLCPPRAMPEDYYSWKKLLDPAFHDVNLEIHEPANGRKTSYLASTKAGRRVYLNRNLVDADQLVVLGRVGYDPVLGYAGGLGDLFPWLSDEATRSEFLNKPSSATPGEKMWPAQEEAHEVGWLLGMPFMVQVLEGVGDQITHVLAGSADAVAAEGRRRLEQCWRATFDQAVDLVVAGISGDPHRHTFADVARAFAAASHVVRPDGKIVVMCGLSEQTLGPGARAMQSANSVVEGLRRMREQKLPDATAAWQLANAAHRAELFLFSNLPAKIAEEFFTIPFNSIAQVQELIASSESCIVLPDAHRMLAVLAHHSHNHHQIK